jgi:hypothetical protein
LKDHATAAEFQKILDRPGVANNEPIGALAHLGLARSCALQGNSANARADIQDFLKLWMDADPDVPMLIAAKSRVRQAKVSCSGNTSEDHWLLNGTALLL